MLSLIHIYYTLRNREDICDRILEEFGASGPHSHIINGHVPVKTIPVSYTHLSIGENGRMIHLSAGLGVSYLYGLFVQSLPASFHPHLLNRFIRLSLIHI